MVNTRVMLETARDPSMGDPQSGCAESALLCEQSVSLSVSERAQNGSKPRPSRLDLKPLRFAASTVDEKITSINLQFDGLMYEVKLGYFKKGMRPILKDISGEFKAGELTAIMGPSGAGKSTLMDILTGYNSKWSGSIKTNGYERDIRWFRKHSCYIMQDDHLQPLLSVQEAMHVAANLKLSAKSFNQKQKSDRIASILQALGLIGKVKTKTSNLSGGQRKRLAIALELISNPPIMFFDEPTSGLDSTTSRQCIELLQKLACEGRTIICTIHQPSALLLDMFDHLYSIADGQCIYQGSIKGLVPYLEEASFHCPEFHNPSDYLLEVSTGEHGDFIEKLVEKSQNGKDDSWRKNPRESLQNPSVYQKGVDSRNVRTPVREMSIPLSPFSPPWSPSISSPSWEQQSKNLLMNFHPRNICKPNPRYPTSFFKQVSILILRNLRMLTRDRVLTYMRFFIHLSIAALMGILYFQIGNEAQYMRDNFNFIFFTVMFLMFTAFNSMALSFPLELPIIKREYFNRWYSLKAYYTAMILSDLPVQLISILVYAIITFLLTGQPMEVFRIAYFTFICVLISFVAQGIGVLNGAIFSIQNAVIIGPLFLLPFTIFSGFFVHLNDAHPYLQWLFHISFLKYGLEGAMLSIFGYDREKLECLSDYCHFKYPSKFLAEVDMQYASYSHSVLALMSIFILIRILTYFAIHIRVRSRNF